MLSQELILMLTNKMKKNPEEAIEIIKKEPKILEALLNSNQEAEKERVEKVRYVNMTIDMQRQLQEKAKQLQTTQGALIGAGILFLLSMLENSK